MHIHDIVKIDTIVFNIVWEQERYFKPPPLELLAVFEYPRSDRVTIG